MNSTGQKLKQTKEMILKKSCYVINGRRNVISGNIYDINGENRLHFNEFYCLKIQINLMIRQLRHLIHQEKHLESQEFLRLL